MKNSQRDHWQFITVIVGIIAIAITIIIYYSQRQYKDLSYEIISNSPLITKSKEIESNVQIFFDKKPVNNVYLVILKLFNSGNIPISAKDYESPLTFNFGEQASILSADVTKTEPRNLRVNLKEINNKIILKPVLLNSGDSITFKFLLSDFSSIIKPEARILGIRDISFKSKETRSWIGFLIGAVIGSLTSFFIMIILFYHKWITIIKH
jgi:hypothetical protein